VQERFNAFSLIDADAALAAAKESTARWQSGAPLSGIDGVPTTIKDIVFDSLPNQYGLGFSVHTGFIQSNCRGA
jgi:Asp-tRNA(Asn)/Glu-tRNA(Gln) amidotransferase A subunit family amidase